MKCVSFLFTVILFFSVSSMSYACDSRSGGRSSQTASRYQEPKCLSGGDPYCNFYPEDNDTCMSERRCQKIYGNIGYNDTVANQID